MVSIESRNHFLEQLRLNSDAQIMVAFVFGDEPSEFSSKRRLADQIAQTVIYSNSSEFECLVNELNGRKVDPSADWINDDYMLLAFSVASRKFSNGRKLCEQMLLSQNVSDEHSQRLHAALLQFVAGSNSVDGDFSFAKLVCREIVKSEEITLDESRNVYRELTSIGSIEKLPTLPRLLALRAFDLIVTRSVLGNLDSSSKIAAEIQSRADSFSIGDWWKIFMAVKPRVLWIALVAFATIVSGAFAVGMLLGSMAPGTK